MNIARCSCVDGVAKLCVECGCHCEVCHTCCGVGECSTEEHDPVVDCQCGKVYVEPIPEPVKQYEIGEDGVLVWVKN